MISALAWTGLWLAAPAQATSALPSFVDEPAVLQRLQAHHGFDLGQLAFNADSATGQAKDLLTLPGYRHLATVLANDLADLRRQDPRLAVGLRSSHRLFDARWLSAETARFELVGVVSRLDRAPFTDPSTGCGEFRFIYRLAYQARGVYSRLPMTVNVVFEPERTASSGCGPAAERWNAFAQSAAQSTDTSDWRPAALKPWRLRSVEVNLQSVRWPSTVRPDLGGHAEYLMRVFQREGATWSAAPLENTPDVARLRADPAARRALRDWVNDAEVQAQLDQGVARLPDRFAARLASSVALNGVHRLSNAPFTQLLDESEIRVAQPQAMRTVTTPHGVLRRLNDLSCVGCHQGRSVAGFHFLGRDLPPTAAVNAIRMPASVHFLHDQPRRQAYLASLLAHRTPEVFRPWSVRADTDEGRAGAHCGLGDAAFASWTCAQGLRCEPVLRDDRVSRTGLCLPVSPAATLSGTACRVGRMRHHTDPHRDAVSDVASRACGPQQICEDPSVGFPNGMCSGGCTGLREGEACGAIAVLAGFNACLARGQTPFDACLSENVRPGSLQACSVQQPCRDDYICAAAPTASAASGVCIPPYFLFQLRVDGHAMQGENR
ncbi:MAG: hypothetical protein V4739_16580 [Pseudomonadota bacterium]